MTQSERLQSRLDKVRRRRKLRRGFASQVIEQKIRLVRVQRKPDK